MAYFILEYSNYYYFWKTQKKTRNILLFFAMLEDILTLEELRDVRTVRTESEAKATNKQTPFTVEGKKEILKVTDVDEENGDDEA
jgi:hypothetical protein